MDIINELKKIIDKIPKYDQEYLESNIREDLKELVRSIKSKPKKLSDLIGYTIAGYYENPINKKITGLQVENPSNSYKYLLSKEKNLWLISDLRTIIKNDTSTK